MSRKAALHNLGCKVNAYETEAMEQMLISAGYDIVPFDQVADVYLINTCSVTNIADRKSRQMIHKAKANNQNAVVVAAGCYVQTSPQKAMEDMAIDIVIGNNNKHNLIALLDDFFSKQEKQMAVDSLEQEREYEVMDVVEFKEHTRAFVKVQDGCNQFCSYCIIPYARGRVRSRDINDVYREVERLSEHGYKEIVLTGIHLSSYGIDIESSLLDLIQKIHEIEGIKRIRLGSLEPGIITEEFASSLARLTKVCPHFHLSLQSGCNATLERMNRKYTAEEFKNKCEILRDVYEHPALTTDVITGFPGETEEEFQMTREFLETINFYEVHLFKYSRRKGTKADLMPNQLEDKVKASRSQILSREQEKRKEDFIRYYQGKEVEVLLEESELLGREQYMTGYTPEYVKVYVKAGENETNQFKKIVFSGSLY